MADSDNQPPNDESTTERERGDPGQLFDDPAHLRVDGKMAERAIREGWIAARWNTHVPKKELIAKIKQRGDYSIAERVEIATLELVEHAGPREKGIGVRVAIGMERQNQIDQLHAMKSGNDPARPQPTTRTPDQQTIEMDLTIPFVPDKEAQ